MGGVVLGIGIALTRLVVRWTHRRHPEGVAPLVPGAIVIFSFATLLLALPFIASLFSVDTEAETLPLREALLINVAAHLAALIFALIAMRSARLSVRELGYRPSLGPPSVLLALATYVAVMPLFFGVTLWDAGLRRLFDIPLEAQAAVTEIAANSGVRSDWILLLCVGIVIPFLEEALFRGLFLGFLLRVSNPWLAIALNAFLFAMTHDAGLAPVFLLGLAMGWLYWRTGSLLAPWLFHMLHNSSVVFFILTTGDVGHAPS